MSKTIETNCDACGYKTLFNATEYNKSNVVMAFCDDCKPNEFTDMETEEYTHAVGIRVEARDDEEIDFGPSVMCPECEDYCPEAFMINGRCETCDTQDYLRRMTDENGPSIEIEGIPF